MREGIVTICYYQFFLDMSSLLLLLRYLYVSLFLLEDQRYLYSSVSFLTNDYFMFKIYQMESGDNQTIIYLEMVHSIFN